MPSTYTTNLGIEKIATGEQSGTWGTTTNTNLDLIDTAVNGIVSITLASAGTSGSPNDLPITDGTASNGRNKFIEFVDGGDLGATAYVQLTPNDAEKIVHIRNSLSGSRSIIVFQGTYNASNDFEIPNGADVTLKFNGAGAGATVTDVNVDLTVTGATIATADINGGTIDGTVIGGSSAAAGTFTTFTSTGIDDNATSTAITIDSSENVGIGTTSPAGILNVDTAIAGDSGASSATRTLFLGQTSGSQATSGKLLIQGIINPTIYRVNIDSSRGSGAAAPLSFSTANGATETMRIDASGNVTIGSTDAGNAGALNLSVGLAGTTAGGIQLWSPTNGSHFVQFGDGTGGDGPYRGLVGYNHTADALLIYTAGSEKMRIDSSGNTGIGTTTPNSAGLGLNGQTLQLGTRTFIATDAGGDTRLGGLSGSNITAFYQGGTERMRIDASGNVGIGTTSPGLKLDLVNASGSTYAGIRRNSQSAGEVGLSLYGGTSGINWSLYQPTSSNDIRFYGDGADRLTINSSGNVGIGTASSNISAGASGSTALTISASTADNGNRNGLLELRGTRSTTGNIVSYMRTFNNSATTPITDIQSIRGSADTLGEMAFFTSNTERMRIDSSGNLLVGTTDGAFINGGGIKIANATAARLKLCDSDSAGTGASDGFELTQSGTAAYIYQNENDFMAFGTNALERMRIASNGDVLVGTTSTATNIPGCQLREDGKALFSSDSNYPLFVSRTDGTGGAVGFYNGGITLVGSITINASSTSYNTSSDVRLKENIVDAPAGNIDAIRVRSFDWKADGLHQTYGMVAQELVDVAPEAVSQGETEDDTWGVDYSKLVPMLVKEIQDLRKRVADLEG